MPSRVIRGEINSSRSLSRVSLEADLTFRALIVAVDDFGRCEADPLILKSLLFPRREKVLPKHVRAWVDELTADGCVRIYSSADGLEYLELPAWENHRGKSKRADKSRFPDPPNDSPGDPRGSAEAQGIRGLVSGSGGSGLVEGGGVSVAAPATLPSRPPRATKTETPDRLRDEDRADLERWARESEPWSVPKLRDLEATALDHARKEAMRCASWLAYVRNWVRRERTQFGRERGPLLPRGVQPPAPPRSPPPTRPAFSPEDEARMAEHREKLEANRLKAISEKREILPLADALRELIPPREVTQ